MYRNIKVLLTDNQKKFKQKESNELNIANFISWSNGESNDLSEDKCHICSKIMYYENLRSMSNGIVLQVFPYLVSKVLYMSSGLGMECVICFLYKCNIPLHNLWGMVLFLWCQLLNIVIYICLFKLIWSHPSLAI